MCEAVDKRSIEREDGGRWYKAGEVEVEEEWRGEGGGVTRPAKNGSTRGARVKIRWFSGQMGRSQQR